MSTIARVVQQVKMRMNSGFVINTICKRASSSNKNTIKLYKMDPSPPARAAMMTTGILGLDVEFIDVNLISGENLTPEYLKKNPMHTVPVLEDGDLILTDSHAIIAYLVDAYGKDDSLYPKDPKERAKVNQRLHFNSGILFPRLRTLGTATLTKGLKKPSDRHLRDIDEGYKFLEAFLNQSKFVSGNKMTIADIAVVASVSTLDALVPIDSTKYPKILSWWNEIKPLPFYQNHNLTGEMITKKLLKQKWSQS